MLPGFTAQSNIARATARYIARRSSWPINVRRIMPQQSWSNCSPDGRLCYTCFYTASGDCMCNWFYDGVWYGTTDCGSG